MGKPLPRAGDHQAGRQPLDVPLPRAGRVSSKSLTSKTSRRSGEANTPKLDRCASPHSWTPARRPASRPGRRPSAAPRPGRRRTARPASARSGSAPVPARGPRPGVQQADRVGPAGGRVEPGLLLPGHRLAGGAAPCGPLFRAEPPRGPAAALMTCPASARGHLARAGLRLARGLHRRPGGTTLSRGCPAPPRTPRAAARPAQDVRDPHRDDRARDRSREVRPPRGPVTQHQGAARATGPGSWTPR